VSISEEIRASAAAHRDLGPHYDSAVAEGLVERIGEEIDRRIDARLFGNPRQNLFPQPAPAPAPAPRSPHGSGVWRMSIAPVVLALGSMGLAIGASAAVLHPGGDASPSGGLVALIWLVVGAINVAYIRRR
jgi:hypothetical protein